jgi:hypothetical protein
MPSYHATKVRSDYAAILLYDIIIVKYKLIVEKCFNIYLLERSKQT